MEITIIKDSKKKKFSVKSQKFGKIITEIGLNSEEYLGVRDGELITEDETIKKGDTIKLLDVVSGG